MLRLLVALFCMLTAISAARAAGPEGFRGLRWGAGVGELAESGFEKIPLPKGMVSRVESYKRKGDDLKVGDATAETISYNFLNGRLNSVSIDFTGHDNLRGIIGYCERLFGKSTGFMVKELEYFVSFDSPETGALIYYQFAKHPFFVRNGRLFLFTKEEASPAPVKMLPSSPYRGTP